MSDAALAVRATGRLQIGKLLAYGMWVVIGLHAIVLIAVHPGPVALSRFLTAAVPILAGLACIHRARRLPARERPVWLWASAGMLLWAVAHIVETVIGHPTAASSLTIDASDFIYLTGTFPLLVALSTTRETESVRAIFVLNCVQIALALILSYSLLYRMSLSPAAATTVMGRIYGAACILLAIMAVLRDIYLGDVRGTAERALDLDRSLDLSSDRAGYGLRDRALGSARRHHCLTCCGACLFSWEAGRRCTCRSSVRIRSRDLNPAGRAWSWKRCVRC